MSYLSRFLLFSASCVLAFLLIAFGLRLILSPDTLSSQLEKSYSGVEFQLQKGDFVKQKNGSIDVIGDVLTDESRIVLRNLNIHVDYYQSIHVDLNTYNFFPHEKNNLFIQFQLNDGKKTRPKSINFPSDSKAIQLPLAHLVPSNKIITEISIFSFNLTISYQLSSIKFVPKSINYPVFGKILANDFSTLFANQKKAAVQDNYLIVSPHLLVFLFFVFLVCFYSYFLLKANESSLPAWSSALVFTWLLLDFYFIHRQALANEILLPTLPSDWQSVVLMLAKLMSSWLLATSLILAFLKKRYGYRLLALGGGYVLAWVLLIIMTSIQQFVDWHLFEYMIIVGEFVAAGTILYLFRARSCSIDELRLEKSLSNLAYWAGRLLILFTIFHLLLATFYLNKVGFLTTVSSRTLLLTLSYDNVEFGNLAIWLISIVALGCLFFGGLRYLNIHLFPAIIMVYLLLSLPIWSGVFLQSVGFPFLLLVISYTFIVIALAILLSYYDSRTWFILLLSIFSILVIRANLSLLNMDSDTALHSSSILNTFSIAEVGNVFISADFYLMLLAVLSALLLFLFVRDTGATSNQNKLLLCVCIGILPIIFSGQLIIGQESLTVWLSSTAFWVMIFPIISFIPVIVFHLLNEDKETLPVI